MEHTQIIIRTAFVTINFVTLDCFRFDRHKQKTYHTTILCTLDFSDMGRLSTSKGSRNLLAV